MEELFRNSSQIDERDKIRFHHVMSFAETQIADKNRDMISGISGNMHDGYDIIFTDGHTGHCRTKKDVRDYITKYCTRQRKSCTRQEK